MTKVRGFLDTPDAKRPPKNPEEMPAYMLAKAHGEIDRLGNVNIYLTFIVVMEFIAIVFLAVLLWK